MKAFLPVAVLLAAGVAVIALSMDWINVSTLDKAPRAERVEPAQPSSADDLNITRGRPLFD